MTSDHDSISDSKCIQETDPWIFNGLYLLTTGFVALLIVLLFHISAIPFGMVDTEISRVLRITGWICGGVVFLGGCILVISLIINRALLPFPLGMIGRINAFFFPIIRVLGKLFVISRLRVEQSFLHTHNRIVRLFGKVESHQRLLVLLPHCLEAGVRKRLNQEIEMHDCTVRVVAGGTQARAAVIEVNPQAILAVACERDLVSGVVELCGTIPRILAVPNIQNRGPCTATDVHMEEFRMAFQYFFPDVKS